MTTIKEIAEMAGVSMTTVYNVLHGNVKKYRKRIWKNTSFAR